MSNYPAYWPEGGWQGGWGTGQNTDNGIEEAFAAGCSKDKYVSAELKSTDVARAIVDYINNNVVAKTYTAPKREATRMRLAEQLAKDSKSSAEVRGSNEQRAREGRPGGPPPPTSGAVEIRRIKVLCTKVVE